jgi:hypothetical protein
MLRREAERLSVITSVEFIESENMWERKARERGLVDASVSKTFENAEQEVEQKESQNDATQPKWTREALEAIADKDGINGLRKIGEEMNVRATSIRQLIELSLKAD